MFNPRQLLCLSTLLKAIDEEPDQTLKEMLLSAFYSTLESNNVFCRYTISGGSKSQGIFSRHDFQPKLTFTENNPWGSSYGQSTFINNFQKVVKGKDYCKNPYDRRVVDGKYVFDERDEEITGNHSSPLLCQDSRHANADKVDFVITDPLYSGNVNYSELADFFYIWLRLSLSRTYPHFSPEISPKVEEIVENPARGKSLEDFGDGLTDVWNKCREMLNYDGLMAFTFHHSEGSTWEVLLESICSAGFVIEAIYPIHGEAESSLHLQDKQAISYNLIHICRKRDEQNGKKRPWAGVRQEIRRKARKEIRLIESGRYGAAQLSAADINIILIGKCLELYSKHYGNIVDYRDDIVPLSNALASIRLMVEMLVNTQNPLPSELENVDPVSYVYLTCLCDRKEIKSDEVHKATRGIIEPDVLLKAGVIRRGRAKRGRTCEVKLPDERLKDLEKIFGKKDKYAGGQAFLFPELEQEWFDNIRLVDTAHYLMALAITGENIAPWLRIFRPVIVPVRVALEYMMQRNPTFQEPIQKVVNLIEV